MSQLSNFLAELPPALAIAPFMLVVPVTLAVRRAVRRRRYRRPKRLP